MKLLILYMVIYSQSSIPVNPPPLRGSLPRKSLISRMDGVSYAGDINLSTHLFLPHDLPPTKKSGTKFRLMGRFYCHTEKKSLPRRIFEENKNSNLPPNLSFQACQWRGRVLTNVWMTDQSKTKVKIQPGYEWKHCPRQF